jgi:hypothetical protein
MVYSKKGSWVITAKETNIPVTFKSQIITQATAISNLKPTWYQAGYFIQSIVIPPIGLVRIEDKINVPTKESSLFIPKIFKPNYQLKFYKADWIDSLKLTIYEDSMPLNYSPDAASIPNVFASSAASFTIPVSATSVSLLAANTTRKKMIISNNSNQDLFIDFDATAAVADHSIKIPKVTAAGYIASYELEEYTGVVSGVWAAAGSGAALVRELVA